jgi:hypothetical protein
MAFVCVYQQGEFKNTTKHFLEKVHVKNFWPKQLEKNTFFLSSFPFDLFLSRFFAVSLHEEPKNTIKIIIIGFFFFLGAPCLNAKCAIDRTSHITGHGPRATRRHLLGQGGAPQKK